LAPFEKIRELEARKRRLLVESELHRQTLVLECDNLSPVAAAIERGYDTVQSVMPYWKMAAPLVAWVLARRRRRSTKKALLIKGMAGLQLLRKGWRLWRAWRM
jgi:hypothetical protein